MASKREFIADGLTVDEIAKRLLVDHMLYLDREAMNEAARHGTLQTADFCNACFTGKYPTPDVTLERLKAIETEREENRDNVTIH